MDPLTLARIQFAANISFHILFPTTSAIAQSWFPIRSLKLSKEMNRC